MIHVKLAAFDYKPQFTHDCTACEFLCSIGEYDVYVCNRQKPSTNTIVRYGNAPHQYTSGTVFRKE